MKAIAHSLQYSVYRESLFVTLWSVRTLILRPRANAPTSVTFYYPQNRLKTPSGEQKLKTFTSSTKRDRTTTTDVAEPWRRTISRPNI